MILNPGETIGQFCRTAIMTQLNCGTLAIIVFAAFAYLGFISQQPCVRFPKADACVNGVYIPVYEQGWSKQDKLIMAIWNIKPEHVAKPVNLWGK